MTSYKVNLYSKIIVAMVFLVMLLAPVMITSEVIKNHSIGIALLGVILLFFLGYLVRTIFIIFKEDFKQISINYDEQKFYITDKNNQIIEVPFDTIECVEIQKGEIVRGIVLGQIKLHFSDGSSYRLSISNIDSFCMAISKDLTVDFRENMFFLPKSK